MFLKAQDLYQRLYLGDARLEQRLYQITDTLLKHPNQSLPSVFRTPTQLKATYRFMDNERVEHSQLLHSLAQGSLARIQSHPRILVIQDTTELDYTSQKQLKGVGHLHKHTQGLLAHTALAVSPQGLPLGVLHQRCWARQHALGIKHQRMQREVTNKESQKWLLAVKDIEKQLFQGGFEGEVLLISDRESDLWEYFTQSRSKETHLLVRQAQDRRLHEDTMHVQEFLEQCEVKGHHQFWLPRADDRPGRQVKVAIQFEEVAYQMPANKGAELGVGTGKYDRQKARQPKPDRPPFRCSVIQIREVGEPEQKLAKPLHWLLCTTLPVTTLQQAIELLETYKLRWLIERFHYILKSGCGIEDLQLKDAEQLKRALGVFSGVAFSLLHMTYLARLQPDQPCDVEEKYWQVASLALEEPVTKRPSNRDFVRMVGRLGGFLARKGDGEPGVTVLWRGWRVLEMMVAGFSLRQLRKDE